MRKVVGWWVLCAGVVTRGEPEEVVIWASAKYDPGTRDYTKEFAKMLKVHRGEPMSNAKYVKNKFEDMWETEYINNWDDGHPAPDPLGAYGSYWSPEDGIQRHPVLLMEDMENGYGPYVNYVVPKCAELLEAFRAVDYPIVWTNWVRVADDGYYGALDRFYGPQGIANEENPMYIYGPRGTETLPELSPVGDDEFSRTIKSLHLSKFADFDDQGVPILYPLLKSWGVDTIVLAGAWTDDCVLATVFDAVDKYGIDVFMVEDGVATSTTNDGNALKLVKAGLGYVGPVSQVLDLLGTPALSRAPGFRPALVQLTSGPDKNSPQQYRLQDQTIPDDAYLFPKLRPDHRLLKLDSHSVSLPTLLFVSAAAALVGALFGARFATTTTKNNNSSPPSGSLPVACAED